LQVASDSAGVALPTVIDPADRVLEARGAVIGRSRANRIDRVVYVVPALYGQLPLRDCYAVARLIGRILHLDSPEKMGTGSEPASVGRGRAVSGEVPVPIFSQRVGTGSEPAIAGHGKLVSGEVPVPVCSQPHRIMLVGPGRWGTTTPSLGVPVCFAEIATVSVLCEIVAMRDDLVPDVSLGTHFFNDLVEMDILYMALFPRRDGNSWSRAFFEQSPNRLAELLPDESRWSDVVRVIDLPLASQNGAPLKLSANSLTQQVMCYLDRT
jgi:hypothetical protein